MIETSWTLFDGRAGEDHAHVRLEPMADGGVRLCTHEWGPGVERWLGSDGIDTWLTIGPQAVSTLAFALIADRPDLPVTDPPMEILAAAYRGDDAASAHARIRLDELGLPYEFAIR